MLTGKQDSVSSYGQLTQTCLQIRVFNREHSSLCFCVSVSSQLSVLVEDCELLVPQTQIQASA